MRTTKSKRPDIQTFRTLAISAVLAFHLRPDFFPLGYLGVDIFFVLSGYLMSMMLSRVTVLNPKSILDFYWRRISRILPMYGVVICSVAILSRFVLLPIDYTTLIRDTRWSLIFGANVQQYKDGSDYWAEVNDSPILLHMWSLGAEVQYYLVVPLIVILQRCFKRKDHQLVFLGVLTIASFASFAVFSISNQTAAFLLMHNRAWQFIIGSIAFEIDTVDEVYSEDSDKSNLISDQKEHVVSKRLITLLFVVLMLFCFSPLQVPIRVPVSMFTGFLLLFGSQNEIWLLSNQLVVKLGNASYVLYLVHWPVITLYKYSFELKSLDNTGVFMCLTTSVVISIGLHKFAELKLLGATKRTTIIVVASLYAATLVVTSFQLNSQIDFSDSRYNYTEINFWNSKMTGNIGRGDCRYDSVGAKWALPYRREHYNRCMAKGNGTARVLIIGNSYAGIVVNYLVPMLQPMAMEIRLFAHHGCRVLIDKSCPPYASTWPKIVEAMKPDVTWIISREPQLTTFPIEEPIESDPTYLFMRNRLEFISKHSKFVVIDYQSVGIIVDHSMTPPRTLLRKIARKNFDFSNLQVTEKKWKEFDRNETLRMDKIKLPNLIRHKISEKQCDEGICYFYNPANLHVYYADNYAHQTREQMALLKPSYADVIEQLKKRLNL